MSNPAKFSQLVINATLFGGQPTFNIANFYLHQYPNTTDCAALAIQIPKIQADLANIASREMQPAINEVLWHAGTISSAEINNALSARNQSKQYLSSLLSAKRSKYNSSCQVATSGSTSGAPVVVTNPVPPSGILSGGIIHDAAVSSSAIPNPINTSATSTTTPITAGGGSMGSGGGGGSEEDQSNTPAPTWLQLHKKQLIIGGLLFVVLAVGGYIAYKKMHKKE